MIYYKIKCKYTVTEETDEAKLMRFWRKADSSYIGGKIYKLFILERDDTAFDALLMFSVSDHSLASIKKRVINELDETGKTIKSISFSKTPEEITVTEAISLVRYRALDGIGGNEYRCSKRCATRWCNAEYMNDNYDLMFDEYVLPHSQLSLSKAKDEARSILADDSFYEELERIYSPLNKRKFCGNPVNYLINAASRETAKNLVKLLTKALYANKRLLSTRITYVTELGDVSYDKAIKNLCENSYASVVVIECSDSNIKDDRFARGHERLSEDIYDILKEYSLQTAFILVDLGSNACKQAVGELIVKEDISFIEISEGKGDKSTGKKYLKMERFLEKNEGLRSRIAFHIDFPDYNADELCDILRLMSKEKGYSLDEEAVKKCRGIFESACQNAEFGNGRFVRNLLEQAIIKQSSRLVKEYSNTKIDKSIVSLLSADDFDINAAKVYKTEKIAIGF